MIALFAYLTLAGLRNRALRQLRRLRRPRYAFAMAIGIAYLWLVFAQPRSAGGNGAAPLAGAARGPAVLPYYALAIALITAARWLFAGDQPRLVFSTAEVDFLFTAPLSRRQLVLYKLLQAQVLLLVSAVISVALIGRGVTGSLALRTLALWVLFSTLYLHRVGVSFVRANAAQHGVSGLRRAIVPLAAVAAGIGIAAWETRRAIPAIRAALAAGAVGDAVRAVLERPAMHALLLPFRAAAAPLFAPGAEAWARAMLPALLLLALHYVWVLRADTAFEEAAAEMAARRAQRLATLRARSVPVRPRKANATAAWIPLAPVGPPGVAIVWKNILAFGRTVRGATLVILLVIFGVAWAIAEAVEWGNAGPAPAVAKLLVIAAAVLTIYGPAAVRNDLRQDLLKLELLRAYPLPGSSIVAAEIAAPTIVLSAGQLLLVAIATGLLLASDAAPPLAWALALAIAIAIPAVNAVRMTVSNAIALLFPGWVRLGDTRASGVEMMGQGILSVLASLLLLGVLLVPPALATMAVSALLEVMRVATGPGLVASAAAGAAVVAAELWAIVWWLGRVFERTDPSAVDRTE